MLIQQCAVQPLDEPIALWPPNLGSAVLNLLELKEQFIRMLVLTSAEFPAIVAEHRADLGVVSLEEGQHVVVEHVDCRDGQLVGVQAAPGIAAEAIDNRLQIDLSNAFERADEEGIDGDQLAGVVDLDVAFTKFGAKAFQVAYLVFSELDFLLTRGALKTQQALMTGQQVMTTPDTSHAGRTHLDAA